MRVLAVMNPSARDFEARRTWPLMEPRLRRAADVALVETVPGLAPTVERLRAALDGAAFDRVIAIGGDGTVHAVVNALGARGFDRAPALAVIPFGTANDLAKSLALPLRDLDRLAAIATGPRLGALDVASVRIEGAGPARELFWFDCVGVGIDADVVFARGRYRELGGYLGYAAALAERSIEQRSLDVRVEVDGVARDEHVLNLIVNNVPIYAGTLEMPGSRRDDGLLDVYLLDRLEYGSKVLSFAVKQLDVLGLGVSELLEALTENQRSLHGRRARLTTRAPVRVQVDGEPVGAATSLDCAIAGRLRVAVP